MDLVPHVAHHAVYHVAFHAVYHVVYLAVPHVARRVVPRVADLADHVVEVTKMDWKPVNKYEVNLVKYGRKVKKILVVVTNV